MTITPLEEFLQNPTIGQIYVCTSIYNNMCNILYILTFLHHKLLPPL